MIHAPWLSTLEGCLAYPTGALLIASGVYQLGESIVSTINNRKIKDNKEMIISILNVLCSSSVIAMGILTAIGLINSPITIIVMAVFGALMVAVNGYNLKKSLNQYKMIQEASNKSAEEILSFLKNELSLNDEKISALKSEIAIKTKEEIIKWIESNLKNFEKDQAENFKRIKEALQNAEEDKKEEILKEIRQIMLFEEIKNKTEVKIERFASLVTKETLKKTLEIMKDSDVDKTKLTNLFSTIKKEAKAKTIAEIFKFFIINVPLMIIPFLNIAKLLPIALYDYLMAAGLLSNIGVNITPRYRNIPPAMIKKILDINSKLATDAYQKYKSSIKILDKIAPKDPLGKVKIAAKTALSERKKVA